MLAHLLNHSLGLVSVALMEEAQNWRMMVTHSAAGQMILVLAVGIHMLLALSKLARRRTLAMPVWELVQILSGLVIPLLLIPHIITTGYVADRFGTIISYTTVLHRIWPDAALGQLILVIIVWVHAMLGLHHWLRIAPWYGRAFAYFAVIGVALPILALTGALSAGREVATALGTPEALASAAHALQWPSDAELASLHAPRDTLRFLFLLASVLALLAAAARAAYRAGRTTIAITYSNGPTLRAPAGSTLLEISRAQGVPHMSVCGGRARCSTCRVRVDQGLERLAPAGLAEALTLRRIHAPLDVRLACQIMPVGAITVTRLVSPRGLTRAREIIDEAAAQGIERTVTLMFLDVRGFTKLAANRLPYDVVFLLNQFFTAVGDAIEGHGGAIDKYMGDGLLAVFGREVDAATACRQAMLAAASIDRALDGLNFRLSAELGTRLSIGMGVSSGTVVIGRIGHKGSATLTVIGQAVNVASRLEALTKEKSCQLIVAQETAELAGLGHDAFPSEQVAVRGVSEPLVVVLIAKAGAITQALGELEEIGAPLRAGLTASLSPGRRRVRRP